ncbi:MAG: HepT-like ribonuclease domain-containing protein [Planctomycetota bacterium]|jgi:uncharacterized protein with HEPN domain
MLDAANDAIRFAADRHRADPDGDRVLLLSLLKCIEIDGEAVSRVSAETQARLPVLLWPDIIGMRHRWIHAYCDVDHDLVWVIENWLAQFDRAG